MIHIITYQSIKGNDEQQIFEDFPSALKLITNLQQNGYPFSYNSVDEELALDTIKDFMGNRRQYEKRDKDIRVAHLGRLSMKAFVATNNQTLRDPHPYYHPREVNIKKLDTNKAIEALELEQKITA